MKINRKFTALLLAILCLSAAGCKKSSSSNLGDPLAQPNNPFDDSNLSINDLLGGNDENHNPNDSDNPSGSILDKWFNDSDYDADAEHGEKKLYKVDPPGTVHSFNGLVIEWNKPSIVTYDISNRDDQTPLCFDPTCQHWPRDEGRCAATLDIYGHSTGDDIFAPAIYYDCFMLIDEYDHKSSPVIYMAYKPAPHYVINGVMHERKSVYCIDRYDISTGKRTVVLSGITDLISGMWTYGDYVYFTLTDAYDCSTICRISKAGGDVEQLGEMANASYELLDVVDNRLYYVQDSRFICSCDLSLKDSKRIMALDEIKGYNKDEVAVLAGTYFGYLYYYSNHELITGSLMQNGKPRELGIRCDLYRVPLRDLKAEPELAVENMVAYEYAYTNDTLFYQPAVYEEVDLSQYDYDPLKNYLNPINVSNGTVYALDLKTLKKTTVCKDTDLVIFFKNAIAAEDDLVSFIAWAYTTDSIDLANNSENMILGTKSGSELKVWYET